VLLNVPLDYPAANVAQALILKLPGQSSYPKWTFLKQNDVTCGWSFRIGVLPINFPEIESSSSNQPLLQHTLEELRLWMPYLSTKSTMIFHDTNMSAFIAGPIEVWALGWDNAPQAVNSRSWKKL